MNLSLEETPTQSPGYCKGCGGAHNREWFMNMGYIEEFYGQVYYCNVCIDEIAKFGNFVKESDYLGEISRVESELRSINERTASIIFVYDALSNLGIDLYALVDFLNNQIGPSIQPSRETADGFRATGFIEQTPEPRPDDIPNDGGDEPSAKRRNIKFS